MYGYYQRDQETVRIRYPIFLAICLGHQLMALATGADTHKMKYGHRGGNHPVKDLKTNRVYISSRIMDMLLIQTLWIRIIAKPAFVNVNDGTNEGLEYVGNEHLHCTVPSGSMPWTTGLRLSV